MNIKETIEKIKLFFAEQPPVIPPVAPEVPVKQSMDVTTTDGKNLNIDVLAVGGIVTMENMPVEDGNYTLTDGSIFTTKNGVIETVTPAAPVVPEVPAVDEEMKKQLATMQAKFAAIENDKAKENEALKNELANQKEAMKLMLAAIEQIGNNSSEAPAEDPKPVFSTENHRKVLEARGKI